MDKGPARNMLSRGEKKFSKKLHAKQKRREGKLLKKSLYNRYSDGWCL